jgi:hypothetical protein
MGERWPITPSEPPGEPAPPLRPFPPDVPWTVNTVAVIIWIGNVVEAILVLVLLGQASQASQEGADVSAVVILALGLVGGIVVGGFCAVMIRRGSRVWRNVTIVLLVLNLFAELFSLPAGLVGMAINGFQIYLLAGTDSSRGFFDAR